MAPDNKDGRDGTVTTDQPLSFDQVKQLDEGSLRLCALAKVAWEDASGQYCTTYFRCLQKDLGNRLIAFDWAEASVTKGRLPSEVQGLPVESLR